MMANDEHDEQAARGRQDRLLHDEQAAARGRQDRLKRGIKSAKIGKRGGHFSWQCLASYVASYEARRCESVKTMSHYSAAACTAESQQSDEATLSFSSSFNALKGLLRSNTTYQFRLLFLSLGCISYCSLALGPNRPREQRRNPSHTNRDGDDWPMLLSGH